MADERLLFRPQALDAQRQLGLGRVQLVRPLALRWITLGVVTAAVLAATFLSLAQYTRKATVAGVLVPDRGLIRLMPALTGTVVERRVVEGQSVLAGDVLFVVAVERPLLGLEAQSQVRRSLEDRRRSLAEAARAQQSLAGTRLLAFDRRLAAVESELGQLDAEASLQQQRLALAEQALTRLQALQADQFISAAQSQSKAEEVLALRATVQGLARQRAALLRDRAEIDGDKRALPLLIGSAVGGLERDLAQADREVAEQDAQQRVVVRAPQSGVVSTVLAEPGQSVSAAAALATLVPQGSRLQAQLYAPSSAIGFVQAGQAVRLRYEAYPYQKFGHQAGHVLQVSRSPLAPAELAALSLQAQASNEPLFRITVGLDEPATAIPLSAGLRLQADVQLDRRRLVEWLFEPLLGLRGRL